MRKIKLLFLTFIVLLGTTMYVNASDSTVAYANGYTVYASITDTYLEGSASGSLSNGASVTVYAWYYDSMGNSIYAGGCTGSPYIRYTKPSGTYAMQKGFARVRVSDGGVTTTRMLIN